MSTRPHLCSLWIKLRATPVQVLTVTELINHRIGMGVPMWRMDFPITRPPSMQPAIDSMQTITASTYHKL